MTTGDDCSEKPPLSRRNVVRLAAAGLGSLAISHDRRALGLQSPAGQPAGTNWAGNVRFSAKELSRPNTVAELQQLVRENAAVHAVGGRHSFSSIADTAGTLISLEHFNQVKVNRENATVDVGAGVKYSDLCPALDAPGLCRREFGLAAAYLRRGRLLNRHARQRNPQSRCSRHRDRAGQRARRTR